MLWPSCCSAEPKDKNREHEQFTPSPSLTWRRYSFHLSVVSRVGSRAVCWGRVGVGRFGGRRLGQTILEPVVRNSFLLEPDFANLPQFCDMLAWEVGGAVGGARQLQSLSHCAAAGPEVSTLSRLMCGDAESYDSRTSRSSEKPAKS